MVEAELEKYISSALKKSRHWIKSVDKGSQGFLRRLDTENA
jgi:hypothetical protein